MRIYVGCLPCAKGTYVTALEGALNWQEQHFRVCKRTSDFASLRGLTPKEKYAALKAAGEGRPLCSCHGLEMRWIRRERLKAGGEWTCRGRLDAAYSPSKTTEVPGGTAGRAAP
jgi:hypothetical protein